MILNWNTNPEMLSIGPLSLRWYGLLFATSFLAGTMIISRIFKAENKPEASVDRLLLYMLLAIVFGARLGEVVFYNPSYYFSNPVEIFKVWKGGLSSHGSFVGIVIALFIYAKRTPDQSYLWILDRIVIAVALGGSLIRIGNFFNSEIIGKPTSGSWGVVFSRIDPLPRHPAQLYESLTYLILFVVLVLIYKKTDTARFQGILFGTFLTLGFSARFLIEFSKEHQVVFESGWTLNMGQRLSIPVILIGLFTLARLLFRSEGEGAATPKKPDEYEAKKTKSIPRKKKQRKPSR